MNTAQAVPYLTQIIWCVGMRMFILRVKLLPAPGCVHV
jgi:hypothetical protein